MTENKIFRPVPQGGDWRRNAVIDRHSDHAVAMGFAETADLIVDHWQEHGPNDLLFVPLVFNYRHAMELVLKAAIRSCAMCLRYEGRPDPRLEPAELDEWLARKARHNLHKLAVRLDEWLAALSLDGLPADTSEVLLSIHALDPSGETFRYAKVGDGSGGFVDAPRPLLSDPTTLQAHVDIVAMHQHFRSAFNLLSGGVMTVLDEVHGYQREMYDDFRPDEWS